jgi:wobble nucleotide-excising tRNase
MKLTRITKLRYRVFRHFEWPGSLDAFGQFNLIYGWNGCGKTTLSSLLSLVEQKAALSEGELELEFDESLRVRGSAFSTAQLPQVRVFNRDFVNATLSRADGIAPIYYLGEDSVEKQSQVDQLRLDLASADGAVTLAEARKANAESRLDDFLKERAKVVKEFLVSANSLAYNNYDKRKLKQSLQALTAEAAAAAVLTDEQKARLRSQKDAQLKLGIEKVSVPSIDLDALSSEVDALVSRSVIAQILEDLASNAKLAAWIQQGLGLHSGENASDTCRFCLEPLKTTRRSALEGHFNDAFARFQGELTGLLTKLTTAKQGASSPTLPDTARFYEAFASDVSTAQEMVAAARSKAIAALDSLIVRVEAKRDNPFAPAAAADPIAMTPGALAGSLLSFNAVIEKHNQTSDQFKASVDEACKKLEASFVADAYAEFLQLSEALANESAALESLEGNRADIKTQIVELERALLEHRRPADELTGELRAYLGRDELRFELQGTGYALTRDGQPVAHLSEGERTAITFLYFLKSLRDRDFDMRNGIVVIDDPVSSLDANALFSAFGYMKERTKGCGQLFILTHSFPFFRNVKNWFVYMNGGPNSKKKAEKQSARCYMLSARRGHDGSRLSTLERLDPLLSDHESEYQYLFKLVYDEAHRTGEATLEHSYGLPNVARRLLEAFLAFRFPNVSGGLHRWLDRVVDQYPYDPAKRTRILRLLHTYSHAEALLEPEHDLTLLAETRPVLVELLELIEVVDAKHYEGLRALVAPAEGAQ